MHNPKKDKNQFKNQNPPQLPEIELYGSLTTKELKKISCRLVRGAERTHGKVAAGRPSGPTFVCG